MNPGYDEAYAAARVKSLDDQIAAAEKAVEGLIAARERYTTGAPFKGNKSRSRKAKADES